MAQRLALIQPLYKVTTALQCLLYCNVPVYPICPLLHLKDLVKLLVILFLNVARAVCTASMMTLLNFLIWPLLLRIMFLFKKERIKNQ